MFDVSTSPPQLPIGDRQSAVRLLGPFGPIALNPKPSTPRASSAPTLPVPPDRIQKVVDGHLKRKDSKPANLKKLTAFIKAQLSKEGTEEAVSQVIKRLTDSGMDNLQNNKVTYPSA